MKVLFYLQLSFLFRQFELISSECRHARLDAAGAESNQGQADQWKLTTDKNKHLKGTNISLIIAWRDCIEEPSEVYAIVKEIGFLSRTFTESSNVWFSHLKVTAEKSKKHCRMIWAFNLGNMVLKTHFPFSTTYHLKMNQSIRVFSQ